MSNPSPPVPPPPPLEGTKDPPALAESSKKKSRLQWDEDNLISNAQEMERAGPRMKIDEPKTPFLQGSETGSSTSGSARTSPPESPSFIPGERLVGFGSLEASMGKGPPAVSSDGASSAGSAGRSVQIVEDIGSSSGGSSPKSKEVFAARRKAHYRNEFRARTELRQVEDDKEAEHQAHHDHPDGNVDGDQSPDLHHDFDGSMPNGHCEVEARLSNGFVGGGQDVHAVTAVNGHAAVSESAVGDSVDHSSHRHHGDPVVDSNADPTPANVAGD